MQRFTQTLAFDFEMHKFMFFLCKTILRFESWSHGFFLSLQCMLCCKELNNEPWTNGIFGCCEDILNFLLFFFGEGDIWVYVRDTCSTTQVFWPKIWNVMFQPLGCLSWVCNRVWEKMEMCICNKIKVQNKQKGVKKG